MDIKTADRLTKLRKESGFSQEALAEKIGLSRQAISKWERAEASPDTDNLMALAELYGMTLSELLDTSMDEKQDDEPQEVKAKELLPVQVVGKKMFIYLPIVCMAIIALYVIVGFIVGRPWWATAWLLFLTIPIYTTVATACRAGATKRLLWMLMTIPVGLTAVLIYLMAGMFFSGWAVAWIVFLAVPFYCYMSFLLTKKK